MHRARIIAVAVAAVALSWPPIADVKRLDVREQWASWRGPLGTGVAPRGTPPLEWSEDKNVRWKTAIPGKGHSTPIVWGDRIFLTTAIPFGETLEIQHEHADGAHNNLDAGRRMKFVVLAVDRRDGAILWQRTVRSDRPHESAHVSGSWASNSAVTDGERLYASFGSSGLYCLDLDGELLWEKDFGNLQILHGHGEGSSPALHKDTVVVNWDHQGQSFVIALDKRTGKQKWKIARDEVTSWSSPLIVEHGGTSQVIIAATKRVRAYDLANGNLIWECGGLSGNVVASPVAADGFVYVANSYNTRAMLAIRLEGAKGDITGTDAVVWTRNRDTPYVPSPVLYDNALCFLKHYQGLLTCVNAKSGETLFGPERLPGIRSVYASLVGAADRIYITDLSGTTSVIKRGNKLELLAQNRLADSFSASAAVVGDELFLRGERSLYCIVRETVELRPKEH
jgi:outer membrane protein assembly factor BamB